MNEKDTRCVFANHGEIEGLTSVSKEARELAECVLRTICKVNGYVFGVESLPCEDTESAKCLRDDICDTRKMLFKAREELENLCAMLGM